MEVSDQLHPQASLVPVLGVCVGFRAVLDTAGENQNLLRHWLSRSQLGTIYGLNHHPAIHYFS
jgi:anthranilate/para-aminobenzoate synthase component II